MSRTDELRTTAALEDTAVDAERGGDGGGLHGGSLGRYVVLELLGHGGMGRVLRAYDPKLQREVALKVVHTRLVGPDTRDRMLREARAMAKLSHPNVVSVFDAEETETGVVVVMEYVAGRTLAEWIDEGPHPWADIVERFVAAGRALRAAHAVGMLHRDFKPANVLVAVTGEVKVTDFGLAKLAAATGPDEAPVPERSGDSLDGSLTRADTILGTPRYMAPEQHRGAVLTEAADQYAFCVALWEALAGTTPFPGRTISTLAKAKEAGPPAWPDAASDVPSPIVDALRRGLSPRARDRWPNMASLLDAVAHGPSRRRRRWGLAILVAGGLVVGGFGVRALTRPRSERCATAEMAEVWDDARRGRVREAITSIGRSYAGGVAQRAERALDAYTAEWARLHRDSCEAATIRGERSPQVMDLQMGCLARAKLGLESAVTLLEDADADVVRRADDLLDRLPPLSRCADVASLQAHVEPPLPSEAAVVQRVYAALADADVAVAAMRPDAAQAAVDRAVELAETIDYEPVRIDVAYAQAQVRVTQGRYADAEAALNRSLELASKWHEWPDVQRAASLLLSVVGTLDGRPGEARQHLPLAEGLVGDDVARAALVESRVGNLAYREGNYEEAERRHRRTLELEESLPDPNPRHLMATHNDLALALRAQDALDPAEAEFRRAIELGEASLGPEHPDVAAMHQNQAMVALSRGRYADAAARIQRALAIYETALGVDHPRVATLHDNLGVILWNQGRYEQAEAEYRRALDIWYARDDRDGLDVARIRGNLGLTLFSMGRLRDAEQELRFSAQRRGQLLGADHPDVASDRNNLALVLRDRGEPAEAEREQLAALEIESRTLGPSHSGVGSSLVNLALIRVDLGRPDEAEADLRRAVRVYEASLSADHPDLARARSLLADLLLDRGDETEALSLAEAAWRRRQADDIPDESRAETAFVLARALARHGTDRDAARRARSLASRAHAIYEALGDRYDADAAEVAQWLAHRPGG